LLGGERNPVTKLERHTILEMLKVLEKKWKGSCFDKGIEVGKVNGKTNGKRND